MFFKSSKQKISVVLLLCIMLTSCQLSKTHSVIDNIVPDYKVRMYTVADLIPYTYTEIKNAQAYYGRELTSYFLDNTATEAEAKRVTQKEKDDFVKELMCRNHNYKIIKKRYAMYVEDEKESKEKKEADRQKEYDDYYKLQNAAGANVIKKYNNGRLDGTPLMSIRVDMSTATMSSIDSIYSEAMCEIYKPVYIENDVYDKLKFGDTIELSVPATNSTIDAKEVKKVTCT